MSQRLVCWTCRHLIIIQKWATAAYCMFSFDQPVPLQLHTVGTKPTDLGGEKMPDILIHTHTHTTGLFITCCLSGMSRFNVPGASGAKELKDSRSDGEGILCYPQFHCFSMRVYHVSNLPRLCFNMLSQSITHCVALVLSHGFHLAPPGRAVNKEINNRVVCIRIFLHVVPETSCMIRVQTKLHV